MESNNFPLNLIFTNRRVNNIYTYAQAAISMCTQTDTYIHTRYMHFQVILEMHNSLYNHEDKFYISN